MEAHGAAPARKVTVGRKRSSTLALAKALAALSAISLSFDGNNTEVARAGSEPSFSRNPPSEALAVGIEAGALHHGQSERLHSPSQPHWHESGILRRSAPAGHADGHTYERIGAQNQGRCSSGSFESCPRGRSEGHSRDGGQSLDRTKRRASDIARRLGQACSPLQCEARRERHRRADQGEGPTHREIKEKPAQPTSKAKAKGARPKALVKEATSSQVTTSNRPLTALADQQQALGGQVEEMVRELALLRQMVEVQHGHVPGLPMEVDIKTPGASRPSSSSPWEPTEEEFRDAAMSLDEEYQQRLEAQYGNLDLVDLTREDVTRVLDP